MFTLTGGVIFTIAGLWETCMLDGEQIESVCAFTTSANELVPHVHDHLLVILPAARVIWLDPASDGEALHDLLGPYPAVAVECRQVSSTVNNGRNEGAACLEPALV
jgi:putative SOS response-associated peptidase YedK